MSRLLVAIDELQKRIFDYQSVAIVETFIIMINELEGFSRNVPDEYKKVYNQSLLYILQAFENRDYLLLADLMEYELKPLVMKFAGGAA